MSENRGTDQQGYTEPSTAGNQGSGTTIGEGAGGGTQLNRARFSFTGFDAFKEATAGSSVADSQSDKKLGPYPLTRGQKTKRENEHRKTLDRELQSKSTDAGGNGVGGGSSRPGDASGYSMGGDTRMGSS